MLSVSKRFQGKAAELPGSRKTQVLMILLPFQPLSWTGTMDIVHFGKSFTLLCAAFCAVFSHTCYFALMCKALGCCLLHKEHARHLVQLLLMWPAFARHPKQTPFCLRNVILSLCGFDSNWEHDINECWPVQKRLILSEVVVLTSTSCSKNTFRRGFQGFGLNLTAARLLNVTKGRVWNGDSLILNKAYRSAILALVFLPAVHRPSTEDTEGRCERRLYSI